MRPSILQVLILTVVVIILVVMVVSKLSTPPFSGCWDALPC